jgi:flavin reductase (DIM6/NTAB) family NADH-FMN oxidoreductase RutF
LVKRSGDDVNIMVANWITQASFEPRQVAFGLQKTSYTHGLVESGKVFSVNIFRKEDAELIKAFTKGRAKNPDKVTNAHYSAGAVTGCPVVDGAAAYLECRVVNIVDSGGDHNVVVAEVVGAGVRKEGAADATLTMVDLGLELCG